jgi:hypothetical protein
MASPYTQVFFAHEKPIVGLALEEALALEHSISVAVRAVEFDANIGGAPVRNISDGLTPEPKIQVVG